MPAEENLGLYQQLFNETLFVFPEKNGHAPIAQAPEEPEEADLRLGDILPANKYKLLGENKKGLIIAVSVPEQEFAALTQNVFLTKILTAIHHGASDVAFVNLPRGGKLNLFDLSKEIKVTHALAFGPGLIDMSADSKVSLYKPASIGNIPLLITDVLADIELDVNKKKLLWNGLQAIFLK